MAGDVLAAFEAMFSSLGFPSDALGVALECAREESIVLNPGRRRQAHVRSGKVQQWRQTFDRELAELFFAEAGDALVTLGYEPDGAWLAGLPDRHPALDEPLPTRQTAATLKP
jgi:hypothetical protein